MNAERGEFAGELRSDRLRRAARPFRSALLHVVFAATLYWGLASPFLMPAWQRLRRSGDELAWSVLDVAYFGVGEIGSEPLPAIGQAISAIAILCSGLGLGAWLLFATWQRAAARAVGDLADGTTIGNVSCHWDADGVSVRTDRMARHVNWSAVRDVVSVRAANALLTTDGVILLPHVGQDVLAAMRARVGSDGASRFKTTPDDRLVRRVRIVTTPHDLADFASQHDRAGRNPYWRLVGGISSRHGPFVLAGAACAIMIALFPAMTEGRFSDGGIPFFASALVLASFRRRLWSPCGIGMATGVGDHHAPSETYMVEIRTEGLRVLGSSFETRLSWEGVHALTRTETGIQVYFAPSIAYILPAHNFATLSEMIEMEASMRSHCRREDVGREVLPSEVPDGPWARRAA